MAVPIELTRAALYQLLGGLLVECAGEDALRDIHDKNLLPTLAATIPERHLADALLTMHRELGTPSSIQRLRTDHAMLFLGAGKPKAPPWESVYRSDERLVWQAPAFAVLDQYAGAGLGYEGMTEVPPDHVGRELLFLATLAVDAIEAENDERRDELLATRGAFLDEHVLRWVPAFAHDVAAHASSDFFRALAEALRLQLASEGRGDDVRS
jgi:putative dimethyl sulfoxide reductase chaperone